MNTKLNNVVCDCEQVRTDLVLHAGGDLNDPFAVAKVRGHLAECGECRTTLTRLTESLSVLQTCATSTAPLPKTNLWPQVLRRLPIRTPSAAAARFNLWVPTAAMTAACAAMIFVTVVQLEPQIRTVMDGQQSPNLFDDSRFVNQRDSRFRGATAPGAMPVDWPAARRWPFAPNSESPTQPRDREW